MPESRINIFTMPITLNKLLNNNGSLSYGSTVGCSGTGAPTAEIKCLLT